MSQPAAAPAPDPSDLIARAHAGDAAALGLLLVQYRNYLKLLARMRLGQKLQVKADPSDMAQEVFLQAGRDFRQFRGDTEKELIGWLRTILANRLATLGRSLKARRRDARRERELVQALDRSSQALDRALVATGPSPSELAARRERAVLLADALEQLPADYREVIVLRHLEGLKSAEVAERMGKTPDAVRAAWTRALARLHKILGESP